MKEDFVTFEQAKKLKDLGFNYKTIWFYTCDGNVSCEHLCPDIEGVRLIHADYNNQQVVEMYNVACSAPTLAQVQKWLYNHFYLWIEIIYKVEKKSFEYNIFNILDDTKKYFFIPYFVIYDTPAKAFLAGIDKALELLKKI